MAPIFLLLHAVFVFSTAMIGEYWFSVAFLVLGVYFFIAFHPSFFRLPWEVIAAKSERIKTGTRALIPVFVEFLQEYSLSVTFALFYAGAFGITYSLGLFSYDTTAFVIAAILFGLSWYFRHDSVPVVEEFFRTNTILFCIGYVFVFAFRAFSGAWYAEPYFVANILLCLASFVFVVFLSKTTTAVRWAFFATMLVFFVSACCFFSANILSYSWMAGQLSDAGISLWTVTFGILLLCACIFVFVIPRFPSLIEYASVARPIAEIVFLGVFLGASVEFLWSDSVVATSLVLIGYCIASFWYFTSHRNQPMLLAFYVGISELFLYITIPSISDTTAFVNIGLWTVFTEYVFPFVVIFLVPSIAIATVYAFRLPKYYAFSLLLFSITYALPVFLYLVVRHFDRFFHSLFLSIAGMGFFGLFLFVSLRISADRNLDHRR